MKNGTKGPGYAARPRSRPVPQAPLWNTFVTVGLRAGEAIRATWSDYDDRERVLALQASTTKTRRGRDVPMPSHLAAELADLKRAQALVRGRPVLASDLMFPAPHGGAWHPENLRRELRVILKAARILEVDDRGRSLDVHALRTTATTRMLRHGVTLPIVMEVIGHRDPALTMAHYCDLRVAATRAALDTMPTAPAPRADDDRDKAAVGSNLTGNDPASAISD